MIYEKVYYSLRCETLMFSATTFAKDVDQGTLTIEEKLLIQRVTLLMVIRQQIRCRRCCNQCNESTYQ